MQQLITIIGGSFDPVHNGHIYLAHEIYTLLNLSKIYLMPLNLSAHRAKLYSTSEERLQMLKIATKNDPQIEILDCEIKRSGISYTIDTLQQLRAKLPQQQPLALVIGEDSFMHFNKWKKWREIIEHTHLIIASRYNVDFSLPQPELHDFYHQHLINDPNLLSSKASGYIYRPNNDSLNISSTKVRELLQNHDDLSGYLASQVVEYIEKKLLY